MTKDEHREVAFFGGNILFNERMQKFVLQTDNGDHILLDDVELKDLRDAIDTVFEEPT